VSAARIALIGASGQLGSALRQTFGARVIAAPSHAELPLEGADAVANLIAGAAPEVVVNCAAFHHVDVCEREPERAFAVNALAVDRAAAACAQRDVTFVTISTDYVFDGTLERAYRESDGAESGVPALRSLETGRRAAERAATATGTSSCARAASSGRSARRTKATR